MNIRPAQVSDIEELTRLLHQVEDVHYQARPDLFVPGGIKHFPSELERILVDPEQPVFVAVDDATENVVGGARDTGMNLSAANSGKRTDILGTDADTTKPANPQRLLGYAMCIWHRSDGSHALAEELSLHIDDLCVDEAAHGLGVGTALYQHVCAYAKQSGARRITLNVWEGNPKAQAFYERLGFKAYSHSMEQLL